MGRSGTNLTKKAAAGDYEIVDPLDYMILELLPEEGSLFAELYPLGETVANLRKKMGSKLESSMIQARLRSMTVQGLVSNSKGVGSRGSRIWQRTPTATDVFKKWKESQGGTNRN